MTIQENSSTKRKRNAWIGVIAVVILLGAGVGAWYIFSPRTETTKVMVQSDDYTCPMHQQIHSDKPGDCPICGMKLVKRITLSGGASSDSGGMGLAISNVSAIKANVSTVRVETRMLANTLRLPGTIEIAEPNERIISARVRGRIEKLYVKETGSYIRAGMALYELYSPELSNDAAQYLIIKNNHVHANANHNDGISHTELETAARSKLKLYHLTDTQIDKLTESGNTPQTFTMYAPASGTILKKSVLEGAWVDEGTALFQIAELSTVWASIDVPQSELSFVHIGQEVSVTSFVYPEQKFMGRVIFISPVLGETTRTARIRVALANPAGKLKIQMAVEGNIMQQSKQSLAIPASSVVHNGDENIVWVKRSDGMFYPQKVLLGYKDADDYYAVISGVEEGDEIAVGGTFLIDSERQLKMNASSMPGMDMKNNPEQQQKPSDNMNGMKMK